jgi:hypothetical protein
MLQTEKKISVKKVVKEVFGSCIKNHCIVLLDEEGQCGRIIIQNEGFNSDRCKECITKIPEITGLIKCPDCGILHQTKCPHPHKRSPKKVEQSMSA